MKRIFIALIIMQVCVAFSQDIIVTKDKELLKVKIKSYGADSIVKYTIFNDTLNQVKTINKADIAGIKFEDGSSFKNSDSKLNINKIVLDKTRIQKKGLHVGISTTGGGTFDNYVADNYYIDEFGNEVYSYENSAGIFVQTVIDTKYYLNNVFGFNIGVGYNVNSFSTDFLNTTRRYFIHNVEIPLRAFITPGNKFGFYAEWGVDVRVPIAAYYNSTSSTIYGKQTTETVSFLNKLSPITVVGAGMFGFHGTIMENIIIYGGPTMLFSLYSSYSSGSYANMGLKFGVTYRLQPLLTRKK